MALALRLGFVVALGALVVVMTLRDERTVRRVRSFFAAESHPLNLAVFRIVVFGALLVEALGPRDPAWFAAIPADLRVPPPGWQWVFSELPLDPSFVGGATWAFATACACALLGYRTRFSATLAVALGVFVLGVPQFFGKLNHHHHLIWFAAILAASPSGDALSIDAMLSRRRPGPAVAYGLPLRASWILIGFVYLFPGLWKLWVSGDAWITGDALRGFLYEKWAELGDFSPLFRIDQHAWMYRTAAAAVIAFEIAFVFLLFWPRTRRWAIVGGLLFHLSTMAFMGIHFARLLVCYVAFVDWAALFPKLAAGDAPPTARPRAAVAVGALLIAANFICGATGIDSWPVAVYPRFHYTPSRSHVAIVIDVEPSDGGPARRFDDSHLQDRLHSSRWVSITRRIVRSRGKRRARLLAAFVELLRANDLRAVPGDHIVLVKETRPTDPARAGAPPARKQLARIPIEGR